MPKIMFYLMILVVVITVSGQDESGAHSNEAPSEAQLPTSGLTSLEEDSSEAQLPTSGLTSLEEDSSETQLPTSGQTSLEEDSSETQLPTSGLTSLEEDSSETQLPTSGLTHQEGNSGVASLQGATTQNQAISSAKDPGEPKVTYYTPVGYAPATAGPLTIKKVAHPVETGKGSGNRIRVDMEITSAKKNKNDDMINDIDIYEFVDESLNIVPPADDVNDVDKRIDSPEESQGLFREEKYDRFSEMPLINFKKLSTVESIGFLKLALMRESPMCSANPDIYKKIYATPELEEMVKYQFPYIINYPILYFNKFKETNFNDTEGIENLENLSTFLKDNFRIEWIKQPNVTISYSKSDYGNIDTIRFTKKTEKNETNEWIQIQIDDADREEGVALLELSGRTTYYLRFNTPEINRDLWQISDWNGIMWFHVRSLSSKDRLFFWYYVRPKKSGDFNTESIIRINDKDYKGWPDIIYPLNIEVGSPDFRFEVTPILADSKVYANSDLWKWVPNSSKRQALKYLITYSGDSSRTYLGNINLTLEQPDKCQIYLDSKEGNPLDDNYLTFYEKNFSKSKTVSLERYISYDNTGTYRIPELWIEGTPYIFKETLIVDDPIKRWYEILNSYYTILTALLILLVNKQLREILADVRVMVHRLIQKIIRHIKKAFIIIASSLGLKKK